jgi:DNA ligase D-like protein (predicted polymerase)
VGGERRVRQRAAAPIDVGVGERTVRVTSPDRVLYPATGTTKADVLAYYVQAAPVMLPHLAGRPVTRKRWPDGVNGPSFFAKDVDPGTPQWVSTAQIPHEGSTKFYPLIDTAAALAWCAQVSAVELHVPQWRLLSPTGPKAAAAVGDGPLVDRVVVDLDPGPGVGLVECARIALALRDRLGELGERSVPVTSGSKGLHLYVPMDVPLPAAEANTWARQVAAAMVKAFPELAVDSMTKTKRQGRVLIDWSQNNPAKTTVAPYSLRGRTEPTVAAPRTWDEIAEPDLQHLHYQQVLDSAGRRRPAVRPVIVVRERAAPAAVGEPTLPKDLAGPVAVTLAKAAEQLPGPFAMAGGTRYQVKWDGYRGIMVADAGSTRLWSRQRRQLSTAFPELVRAGHDLLPPGTVIDGEVCIWSGDRLDFDQLQRRMVTGARTAEHARRHPAAFMAFDLLAHRGQDLRDRPWTERQTALEELAARWVPPLQLTPVTDDVEQARHWMQLYRPAGVEGIVAKAATGRYTPGERTWVKVKQRNTIDVIAGAVIGPIEHPTAVVAGLYIDGELTVVGRTGQLNDHHARLLAERLTPASPEHPWPDRMLANRFSPGRDRVALTKVEPTLVIEVAADAARQGHGWRHPLRLRRPRDDMTVDDLLA